MNYQEFLEKKKIKVDAVGFKIDKSELNPMLYDYQADIVEIALWKGRFLLMQDTGLGKSPELLEWAYHVKLHVNKPVLIVAPLGVTYQLQKEGEKFNRPVIRIREPEQVTDVDCYVINYDILHKFTKIAKKFGGIVFDESAIFKGLSSKTRKLALQLVRNIPFRLCASATPSPNDFDELLRQAEILGIMKEKEAKANWFIQDGNSANKWRLKGHAEDGFWEWVSEWAVAMRMPSDLGYLNDNFQRSDLHIHEIVVAGKPYKNQQGQMSLFPLVARTMSERREARKSTIFERVSEVVDLVHGGLADYIPDYDPDNEPMIAWREYLNEADEVVNQLPEFVDIRGGQTMEEKEERIINFANSQNGKIVTDPRMFGHGMNFQHSRIQFFIGLSDSFESIYQAIRRQWRNFQKRDVHVFFITATTQGGVVKNIKRKEAQHDRLYDEIVARMAKHYNRNRTRIGRQEMEYKVDKFETENSVIWLGDSAEMLENEPDESVALTITSVPFPGMYAYTNSARDAGNCKDGQETTQHIQYIMEQVYRTTKPGRLCCIHLTQEPLFKWKDGHVGRLDFRGDIIRMMQNMGWIYWSEVSIVKNPQMKAMRTNDSGLTQASVHKDMARAAPAMNDYVVIFKKMGENDAPIPALISPKYEKMDGWLTMEDWIAYAHGVWQFENDADLLPLPEEIWLDIQESDVLRLNGKQAHVQGREDKDEKHLCPLQNGVIERLLLMYSNPDETVLDPFSGQGTTGYWSIYHGRKYRGCEIKESYWKLSQKVLQSAEKAANEYDMFEYIKMKQEAEFN